MATNKRKATKKVSTKKASTKRVVKVQPLGSIKNHAGMVISINMKNGAYFGVGSPDEQKLWLSPEQWHTKVPSGLTEAEALQVTIALRTGRIVAGKKWIPAIDKAAGTKEEYVNVVKTSRSLDEKTKQIFRDLVAKGSEGGYTALEILQSCLTFEREGRGRSNWMIFLQAGLDAYTGPVQLVEDFPDDPDSYEVVVDQSRGVIVSDNNKNKKDDLHINVMPIEDTVEPKIAEEELDKFLG